jgi:hypothetical protein
MAAKPKGNDCYLRRGTFFQIANIDLDPPPITFQTSHILLLLEKTLDIAVGVHLFFFTFPIL